MRNRRTALACLALTAVALTGCQATSLSAPTPTAASPTDTATAAPTRTPIPTRTPSPTPTPGVTCEQITTAEFDANVTGRSWVTWALPRGGVDFTPFEEFFGERPKGSLVCRSGADPGLATDDVVDLAWSPVGPADAAAAQERLEVNGYQRIDAPEGVYYALPGDYGFGDAEGFAQTYLFTATDVRWAIYKSDVRFVKAPSDPR